VTPLVVCDSSACVPPPWHGHPALRVVPLGVLAGDRRLPDTPAAADAVAAARRAGLPVRTVAPSPVDYVQVLDGAVDGAVVVTPAAEVAVMHRNASLAARLTTARAVVVDCRAAGPAQGLCVVSGLQAVDRGADTDAVASAVRAAAATARLAVVVPDLGEIAAAVDPTCRRHRASDTDGRTAAAGRPAGRVAERARQAALVGFRGGVPVPIVGAGRTAAQPSEAAPADTGPSDPMANLVDHLVHAWAAAGGAQSALAVVFHADDEPTADQVADRLRRRAGVDVATPALAPPTPDRPASGRPPEPRPMPIAVVPISPAMATHTGRGCVGVAWLEPAP